MIQLCCSCEAASFLRSIETLLKFKIHFTYLLTVCNSLTQNASRMFQIAF